MAQRWIVRAAKTGAAEPCIEPGSPWENGYCESFNSKLRDEFLNGEIFYSIKELRVLTELWRVHYNTVIPHSSLGYRPPAPEAWLTRRRSWIAGWYAFRDREAPQFFFRRLPFSFAGWACTRGVLVGLGQEWLGCC